ncbi:DUF721 domain-containing protein [Kiloniella majae]|uniref:DUF721 domain-containing protein n=1 Tax=Kiloniella majae TaxID=1938558 RepID=UPI000A277D01|nr:DciA family protein [Kiloniella majae]
MVKTTKPKKAKSAQKKETRIPEVSSRRRKSMQPIAATLPKLTKRITGKRGFAEAGLIEDWAMIVGKELADQCLPVKLRYPSQGIRNDGTLLIKADPAFALAIQQQTPQVIERVNSHFGYRAIARISLQQGPLYKPEKKQAPELPKLTTKEQQDIKSEFSNVENEALRTSLERLAATTRAKNKINK